MTISTYIFYCRGSIFNSSKLPVPWKPCGLYRGGDLCRSHRAEDGRYVSFLFFTICEFLTICGFLFCWRYVSFLRHYFVHDIWVRLNHKAWPHLLIMWIMWILSQKQVCIVCVVIKFCWKALLCHFTNIIPFSQQHISALFLKWRKNHLANTYC